MTKVMERVIPQDGYDLHLIHTKKFKTIHVSLKFMTKLSEKTVTKRALLPYILQQGTKSYPTATQLRRHLDELYGTILSIDSSKKGENHILTIRLELANEQYISGTQDLFSKCMQFLREILYAPKLSGGAFDPQIVEREKETLKSKIESLKEDKMSFANTRLIEEMCEDELYRLRVHGYEEELNSITPENLYEYYQELLTNDHLDIFVVGDIENTHAEKEISALVRRNQQSVIEKAPVKAEGKNQTIVEKDEVQQAKLHFGYRTNITYSDEDYAALQVFNGLFGGFPNSKLFINVREKHSLAYYAASRIESHKGLMFVFSGIAPEKYEQAKDIISEQMDIMRNGGFSEDELKETKEMTVNQLKETLDNANGMIELHYQRVIAKSDISPEQLLDNINKVTKEKVIKVANKIKLDTIYLLTSKEGA